MARTMLVQQNETVAGPPRRRLTGLDGLRGVAALAVVVSHILGTTPAFIDPASGSVAWWLSYTPISLLWNGKEAVIVFFVLSGFVLSRPFLRSTSPSWRAYYPRRLVRLYLPMWGALLFTAVMTFLVARHGMAGSSLWTNGHVNRTGGYVGQDALLPHIGDTFDGPLWSLRWEVLFSLALPLYVVLARSFRVSALTRGLVVVGILVLGVVDIKTHSIGLRNAVLYLPMFGVGVLMAAYETPLLRAGRFVVERSRWLLAAVIAAAVVLADSSLEVYALRSHYSGAVTTLCHGAGVSWRGDADLARPVVAAVGAHPRSPIDPMGRQALLQPVPDPRAGPRGPGAPSRGAPERGSDAGRRDPRRTPRRRRLLRRCRTSEPSPRQRSGPADRTIRPDPTTDPTTESNESRSGHRRRLAARDLSRRRRAARRAVGGMSGQFDSQACW